ncbi:helix-turn-helix domain-containing protein [Nocardia xishanensis]|uniref:Helix-turn-helix domain-containing protein n=1 Tax=Nocardia xishanensis TaxID=238964 RepID=A0ABW7XCL2_9NOCA
MFGEDIAFRGCGAGCSASSHSTIVVRARRAYLPVGDIFLSGCDTDDVRRETAQRLLRQTDLPLSQVSGMVGFSEQSALSKASHRWWGVSPRAVRAAVTTEHGEDRNTPTPKVSFADK